MPHKYFIKCDYCGTEGFFRGKRFCCRDCFQKYRLENRKEFILTQEHRDKIRDRMLKNNPMKKAFSQLGYHGKYNRAWRIRNPDYFRIRNKRVKFVY